MIQKCLGFLAVTTVISQIVIVGSSIRRRRYFEPSEPTIINPSEEPPIHPPWWDGPKGHEELKPAGPFDHETYGFSHGGYDSGESSSEEDHHDSTSPNGPSRTPGYGGSIWWRPPPPKRPKPPPNTGENTSIGFLALCVRSCPVTAEYNPVCGSNKVTYQNPGQLECEQNCGVAVALSKLGPCSSSEQIPLKPSVNEDQVACMRSCLITGEYNPVCGSNNITYSNLGRLECAQNCGIPVTLTKMSACAVSEPTPTTTENILSIAELTAACMLSCPVTSEFNPVCGSDNITYNNPGRLDCAQQCGVDVKLTRHTSCEVPITQEENNNTVHVTTTESNQIPTSSSTTAHPYINTNTGNDSGSGNNDINTSNNSVINNVNGNDGQIANEKNVTFDDNLNNSNKVNSSADKDVKQNDEGDNHYNNDNNASDNNSDGNASSYGNESNSKGEESNSYSDGKNISESKGHTSNVGNSNCDVMSNKKPPSIKEVMACMQTCTLTSESNPVCGTDLITYMNPGRLLCAQFCGVDVKLKKFAPCSSNSITNVHCLTPCTNAPVTEIPTSTTAPIPSIEACMESCPSSVEFKPVCGNNNITYRNLEKLQCARRCGIDVKLKRNTHCSAPEIKPNPNDVAALIQECIQQCSVPQKYEPICGTDNVTYNNTGHLICARQCGLEIEVKQSQPCGANPNVTTTPPSTTTTKIPVHNGLNFTIDPSILDSIWSENTSPKPNNNDDEDFELDQRVQDRTK